MRISYDFYKRCVKLPVDQLAKTTAISVYLFGSLSAAGKGHGNCLDESEFGQRGEPTI